MIARGPKRYTAAPVLSSHPECNGRRVYDRPAAVKLAQRVRRNTDSVVEGYHCRHCGHWHIGEPTHLRHEVESGRRNSRRTRHMVRP